MPSRNSGIGFLPLFSTSAPNGAWVYANEHSGDIPAVNIVAANPRSDAYYTPAILDEFPVTSYRFVDETIFIYGRDPTSRSSWTLNNLLPLHSLMARYEGTNSSWFMRVTGKEREDANRIRQYRMLDDEDQELDTNLLAPYGREIILNTQKGKPQAPHHISPPSKSSPTCFARAVIGLESRCTRPFCGNMIGGSKLIESLRTKALDILSASMSLFQNKDPNIIHTPQGENVAVVSHDNLTIVQGESAPRSRIQVALLGRYGNTSIPNANALELSLLSRGFAVNVIHLDRPSNISISQAAQLFADQSILVAPQGDALGYSNWMNPGTVVVSILPRFTRSSKIYTDRMMAFGKRFFAWDCQNESCVQPNRDLAHECIEASQYNYERTGISAEEFEDFANMRRDFRQESAAWKAISDCYTRDVSRRISVEELTILIEGLAKDFEFLTPDSINKGNPSVKRQQVRRDLGDDEGEEEEEEEEEEAINEEDAVETEEDQSTDDPVEKTPIVNDGTKENVEESGEENSEEDQEISEDGGLQSEKETPSEIDQMESEVDINIHEYDEQSISGSEEKETDKVEEKEPTPVEKNPWPPVHHIDPIKAATPMALKYQLAIPKYDFVEFCKQGHCCGSGKTLEYEATGLTPCAASMSAVVFGVKNVWGQVEEEARAQESQKLVWQVDLGRN
ncbi:hypothetical protein BGZ76_008607 [Entomortierella beljakovae]|nr:hypothetical protein BGZ76_008607 [Entomortierella beljakovae]